MKTKMLSIATVIGALVVLAACASAPIEPTGVIGTPKAEVAVVEPSGEPVVTSDFGPKGLQPAPVIEADKNVVGEDVAITAAVGTLIQIPWVLDKNLVKEVVFTSGEDVLTTEVNVDAAWYSDTVTPSPVGIMFVAAKVGTTEGKIRVVDATTGKPTGDGVNFVVTVTP